MKNRKITLNELPEYSLWPRRMLGFEPWKIRKKTSKAVTREYNVEKWGGLLRQIKSSNFSCSLDSVNNLVFKSIGLLPCYSKGEFILMSAESCFERYLSILEYELQTVSSSSIVELGAGYGAIILKLAKRNSFRGAKITAGEYTKNGREIIKIIAKNENIDVAVYSCDLSKKVIIDGPVPEKSIIFTSYAACYLPIIKNNFVDSFIKLNPALVIHFEPCYEHYDERTLLGLMCRRYIEMNDYNRNLVSILHQNEKEKKIKMVREKRVLTGSNPFLPISVVAWKPA